MHARIQVVHRAWYVATWAGTSTVPTPVRFMIIVAAISLTLEYEHNASLLFVRLFF